MLGVTLTIVAIAAGALAVYLLHERLGATGLGLAALRTVGLGALALLLLNPVRGRRMSDASPTVLLDASLSMDAAGGRWREALDTARARAGDRGAIVRFGSRVTGFDTLPPMDGRSELAEALRVARGRGGPVVVVTDGELEDVGAIDPTLVEGVQVVVLPRGDVPDAALVEAVVDARVGRRDSVAVRVGILTSAPLTADSGRLEVLVDGRRLLVRPVVLPPPPGLAQRRVVLPPGVLPVGSHVLQVALTVPGDGEPRNDRRWRPLTVSPEPGIVVLAAPVDWEARFFLRELGDVAQVPVRGYALVQEGRWLEMSALGPAPGDAVRRAAGAAALVVVFGAGLPGAEFGRAVWQWRSPAGTADLLAGDWYPAAAVPASPLAGRLAGIRWDSLPPLTGMAPTFQGAAEWVALAARQGRRGPERPVVVGRDSAGTRRLVVLGDGLWRWAFRGGAPREAYRALVAAGTDWLLGAEGLRRAAPLTASEVVPRGVPMAFRWSGEAPPESLGIRVSGASTTSVTLRFDADGLAMHLLPPGSYQWTAAAVPGAGGRVVVEEYSDELQRRPVTLRPGSGIGGFTIALLHARDQVWLFVLVIAALAGEWVWRHRRGLP